MVVQMVRYRLGLRERLLEHVRNLSFVKYAVLAYLDVNCPISAQQLSHSVSAFKAPTCDQ